MKFLKALITLAIIIVLSGLGVFWYSGGFTEVTVKNTQIGPLKIVLRDFYGDYSKAPLVRDSVKQRLINNGITPHKSITIYYDNPEKQPTDSLYCITGYVLNIKDTNRIKELRNKDFRLEQIGPTPGVVVNFPNRTRFSSLIGIWKGYPALKNYIRQHELERKPFVEIHGKDTMVIAMEDTRK